MRTVLAIFIVAFFMGIPLVCLFLPKNYAFSLMEAYMLFSLLVYCFFLFSKSRGDSSAENEQPNEHPDEK